MTRRTVSRFVFSFTFAAFAHAPPALAQDGAVEVSAGAEAEAAPADGAVEVQVAAEVEAQPPAPPAAPVVATPPAGVDGVRFRGAIAASGGAEFASGFEVGMGGLEGRVGVQINNLIGVYVQPSLAFGGGVISNSAVVTGTAGISALIDFTIENHFFVGIGGGVGILNNPIGPEIHLRIGAYPVVVVGQDGYSRQGLVVGVDARMFFLSGAGGDLLVGQVLGSIGYEVF